MLAGAPSAGGRRAHQGCRPGLTVPRPRRCWRRRPARRRSLAPAAAAGTALLELLLPSAQRHPRLLLYTAAALEREVLERCCDGSVRSSAEHQVWTGRALCLAVCWSILPGGASWKARLATAAMSPPALRVIAGPAGPAAGAAAVPDWGGQPSSGCTGGAAGQGPRWGSTVPQKRCATHLRPLQCICDSGAR